MSKEVKIKEPIRIRTKKLNNGNESIYLDIYVDGKRNYEFLKLYLVPSCRSPTPRIITPPLELANEEYDSHNAIGNPPSAFFTSRQLSSLYLSKFDKSNKSDI